MPARSREPFVDRCFEDTIHADNAQNPPKKAVFSTMYIARILCKDCLLSATPCPKSLPDFKSLNVFTSLKVRLIRGLLSFYFGNIEWLNCLLVRGPSTSIDRCGRRIRMTSLGSDRRLNSMILSSPRLTLTITPSRFKSKSLSL